MSAVSSGQPKVDNGHSAEENQVSSTSGSCSTGAPQAAHLVTSSMDTVVCPASQ
jgi:hypothetical protein